MAPTAALQTPASYLRSPVMLMCISVIMLLFIRDSVLVLAQDVIEYLPGFPGKLPFPLETGYIGVGENKNVQLFYYFAQSYSNPEDDPLVLWMTGGPGCSALSGFMYKIGPLSIDPDSSEDGIPTLLLNEYSWTKRANILFLDQPAGTGFSYAKTSEASYTNDTLATKLVYEFLRKWLINHPKYLENPLYIGGDSYSGIYVPLVVNEVYNGIEAGTKPVMNMKGYILGNPKADPADENGRISYAHRMGLLSDELYQSAREHCHGYYLNINSENVLCSNDLQRINECVEKINSAQILEPSCSEHIWSKKTGIFPHDEENPINFLQQIISKKDFSCRSMSYSLCHAWANHKLVQKALHIHKGSIDEWVRCNKTIQNNVVGPSGKFPYIQNIKSTVPFHQIFTKKRCRAFIYSGDHDMLIPHTSTKNWIDSLKVPIRSDWRPWLVEGQIAGYTVTYANANTDYELTFATVKGAGHTAPEYKPHECFAMFNRWFDQSPL